MMEVITDFHDIQMWFTIILIAGAVIGYSIEKIPMEITSISVVSVLLLFFFFFPLVNDVGNSILSTEKILLGFANPALITVLALLVLGQAMVQTGALNEVANIILKISKGNAVLSVVISLVFVAAVSAFLNNTPVVVIFIPIMAALAKRTGISVSKVMIPLSFASILGGMMTLIGSSTNLLVSGVMVEMNLEPLKFFDFTIPGLFMAAAGLIYVLFIVPKFLPDRASLTKSIAGGEGDERQFLAQIEVDYSSDFVGQKLNNGRLEKYINMDIRMIQRGEHAFLPPFDEGFIIRPRDMLVLGATKSELTEFFSGNKDTIDRHFARLSDAAKEDGDDEVDHEFKGDMIMAEVVVSPASKISGRTLQGTSFNSEYNLMVLGIQRKSRVIRTKITEVRLSPGDVLLVMGMRENVLALNEKQNFLLMEWSAEEIHSGKNAGLTACIFGAVVGLAAFDLVPITITAFAGATLVLITGCINLRQASRALDLKIVLMIAASLALGIALQATGGAEFIAQNLLLVMEGASVMLIMSVLFLVMIILTNLLSNNAAAVLFTPIAINLAAQLGVDPKMFIFAVIFACNCSFITPIGYQTNLMVMGPGHYKFVDFIRAGIPLALIVWLSYCAYAYLFFDF